MASSKQTTASLFKNMNSISNINTETEKEEIKEPIKPEPQEVIAVKETVVSEKVITSNKKDSEQSNRKTVSFTTPGEIKDKLQRYSIAFPDSISQYITDLIKADFEKNEEKYEEIAILLEKVKGKR